jgi:hypothetical protein
MRDYLLLQFVDTAVLAVRTGGTGLPLMLESTLRWGRKGSDLDVEHSIYILSVNEKLL